MIPLPQILAEIVMALGGALLVANVLALVRAPRRLQEEAKGAAAPPRPQRGRAIVNAVIGFVVLAWGFASFVSRGSS